MSLNAGYKWELNRQWFLGIEAESLYLGQVSDTAFSAFAVNAIAEHPFNNKFSITGKIGTATEDLSDNYVDVSSDSTVIPGTSLLYHWSPQWAAYASYEHIFGNSIDDQSGNDALSVDTIGLGVQYTF